MGTRGISGVVATRRCQKASTVCFPSDVLWLAHQSALSDGIFLTCLSCFEGTLPGIIVKLISEGKANFNDCKGPFYLPSDLTSIKDIEKIDLSSLDARLKGANEISCELLCAMRTALFGIFLTRDAMRYLTRKL